jgi:dipeptidyl aminopeptidase/acylaminoacyl peptidase
MVAFTLILTCALLILLVQWFADAAAAPESHPFTVHDLWAMERISDPQVAPDGRRIVFTNRVTDFEKNKGVSDLWLVNVDGGGLRRLTTHPAGSHDARWSPDGKRIYFLSARSESAQVWKIPVDGGEAEQVTDLPLDVNGFLLSRDGTHLLLAIEVFPDCETLKATKERLDEIEKRQAAGRVYEKLFIRHWDSWKDGRRSHLFAMPVAGGEPVDLMKGMEADVPSKPFGDMSEATFAPDGKSVVLAARNAGREEAWSTQFDLYEVRMDGSAGASPSPPPKCLTEGNRTTLTQPVFSPDGKTLAYLAMKRPGYEADRLRIVVRPWPDGQARMLTEAWDRSAGGITWSNDGKTIYTHADNLGQHSLFTVDVASGEVRTLVKDGKVFSPVVAGELIVFGLNHHRSPVELYTVRPDGSDLRQITHVNAGKLAQVRMGESEQFTFKGWNDEEVYCYVVKPADFDPARKYPVAFLIHGGPQGSFGNDFHYRWNPQAYAGAGYAVVMVDFHGSTGYGQAFTDAINGHWGDRPFEDLQKGLAAALERYPWMDGERVAALGASYGGYMTNWIAGNWPDRFRCLVNHDGNLCERLAYYDTEELWFPEWEHGGPEWASREDYEKHNPINHIRNWKTPMLVIHGAKDYRVVDSQGISTFTALQRRGIPSKLLYFPDENHWVLKPANGVLWHETVLGWLDQWTMG